MTTIVRNSSEAMKGKVKINLNLTNITEGKIIKNYKEMCKLLGEAEKNGGTSQKAQLKEWRRYFEYEKDGRRFIITNVYDTPLEKNDGRAKGNNSIYVDYIELLLMYYLSSKEGYTHHFTTNELYFNLAFVNDRYIEYKRYGNNQQVLEDLKNTPVTNYDINKFNARTQMKFRTILFSALKSLRSRRLLEFEEQIHISKRIDGNEIHEQATAQEIKKILEVENSVLSEMGFEKINNVYLAFKGEEFRKKVNAILLESYEWNYSYKKYNIIFLGEQIKQDIPKVEIALQKKMLNNKIINAIDTEAEAQYNNANKKIEDDFNKFLEDNDLLWGAAYTMEDFKRMTKPFIYKDNYVEAQKCLSEYFLKL